MNYSTEADYETGIKYLDAPSLNNPGHVVAVEFFLDDVELIQGSPPEGQDGGGDLEHEDEEGAEKAADGQRRTAHESVAPQAERLDGAQDEKEAEGASDEGADDVEGHGQRDGHENA